MNRFLLAILPLLLVLGPGGLAAQATATITGSVRSAETGAPIRGASVQVEGTNRGALTDANGAFRLTDVPAGSVTLVARSVGYTMARSTAAVTGGATQRVDFSLQPQVLRLNEVVVTGLPVEVTQRELGTSRASIDAAQLATVPTISVDEALQGRMAGVEVYSTDGAPGGGMRFRIRGANSILGASEPLLIVDGVIVDNANRNLTSVASVSTLTAGRAVGASTYGGNDGGRGLTALNPEDIASIEILKGAAAASLYGSRASNGVIVVTTKSGGRHGQPRFTYSLEAASSRLSRGMPGYKSSWTGAEIQSWADSVNRLVPPFLAATRWTPAQVGTFQQNAQTDWLRDAFREGDQMRNTLTVAGGDQDLSYYASLTRASTDGHIRGTDFGATGFRLNVAARPIPRLQARFTADLSQDGRTMVGGGGPSPFQPKLWYVDSGAMPFMQANDIRLAGGIFGTSLGIRHDKLFDIRKEQDIDRYIVSTFLKYTLLPNLEVEATVGVDQTDSEGRFVTPFGWTTIPPATGDFFQQGRLDLDTEGVRQRNLTLGLNHTWAISPTMYLKSTIGSQYDDNRRVYVWNRFQNRAELAPELKVGSYTRHIQNAEFYSEVRTLGLFVNETLGLNDRLFLNFGGRADRSTAFQERFFFYPRASASFAVTPAVRLRAAYGTSGIQPPPYQVNPLFSFDPAGYDGSSGVFRVASVGNPDLKPERQTEIEAGVDLTLLGGRVTVDLTAYDKQFDDLLLVTPVNPATTRGARSKLLNAGAMTNRGVEVGLTTQNLRTDRLSWSSRLQGAWLSNEVTRLSVPEIFDDAAGTSGFQNVPRIREGYPIGSFWGTTSASPQEAVHLGSPLPSLEASLGNEFELGPFFATVLFSGKFGHQKYSASDRLISRSNVRQHADTWNLPAAELNARQNHFDLWVHDADFIKLRTATVGINVPPRLVRRAGVQTMSLAVSGTNLHTWTSYPGAYDVESEVSGFNTGATWVRGVDFFEPGLPRNFAVSMRIGF